jgi:hypothetical protein
MMPYGSYQLYQTERPKSAEEIRRADEQLGEMSRSLSSAWQHAKRPTGALLGLLDRRRPAAARACEPAQSRRPPSSPPCLSNDRRHRVTTR